MHDIMVQKTVTIRKGLRNVKHNVNSQLFGYNEVRIEQVTMRVISVRESSNSPSFCSAGRA